MVSKWQATWMAIRWERRERATWETCWKGRKGAEKLGSEGHGKVWTLNQGESLNDFTMIRTAF